ncbi:MAG: tRNA (guanosine(37)-N1)-methyltransferase TrmD [bacterium]|nr:tRNA (guanosine(37)-N1)-methyltransferase TrmD [bacterium]
MHFHIITLFPKAFGSYLGESILKRAIEDKKIRVSFYNPRDFVPHVRSGPAANKTVRIDKPPYGGGPGLVIQAEPVVKAIAVAVTKARGKHKIIFLSPSGKQFTNSYAAKVAKKYKNVIIVCGRYEGIDARVKKVFKVDEISVGPFVLTGGELPAMTIIDVMARQVPGILGNFDSLEERRVSSSEVYTRPEVFSYKGKSYRVPKVLLSGHRAKIEEWKRKHK